MALLKSKKNTKDSTTKAKTKASATKTTKSTGKATAATKTATKAASKQPSSNSKFNKWWETEGMALLSRGMDFRGIVHRALEAAGNGQSYQSFLTAFNESGLSVNDIKKAVELAFSL